MQQSMFINRLKVQTWKWHVYTSKQKQLAQRYLIFGIHIDQPLNERLNLSCSIGPTPMSDTNDVNHTNCFSLCQYAYMNKLPMRDETIITMK